jgi:asparagine synthase (glutamine-hydrolysing)
MSGIVGIVNTDGAPIDRDLLSRLTQSIAWRGPDTQEIRVLGCTGFGHAMLRTTWEAEREHQPCSLNGEVWVTADCRIDGREDLIRELASSGRSFLEEATDPELILHAYAVWGTDCVVHLIGDFSFALWDEPNRRLFCARDQMGVKLLHYVNGKNCLVFGNTLNSLLLHPAVSGELDDVSIGDYLLIGYNHEIGSTFFRAIRSLPPAHSLIWADGELQVRRYWTLPIDPPLSLHRRSDYTGQFLELLNTATRDRLRTHRAALFMSGGLDSAGLAAIAKELVSETPGLEIEAHTVVYDRLIPDTERHYAGIVARHLGIPIHFHALDDQGFYEGLSGETEARRWWSPLHVPQLGPSFRAGYLARVGRVGLSGNGPDNALAYEPRPYVWHQLSRGHYGSLLRNALSFPFLFGRIPLWGRFRRSGRVAAEPVRTTSPPWLNEDFSRRLSLQERFRYLSSPLSANGANPEAHPVRPQSYASMGARAWSFVLEAADPSSTGLLLEIREPYLDMRMLRFLLSVPAIPWCREKHLLRSAMKGRLPEAIIRRPKTALAGVAWFEKWKETGLPVPRRSESVSAFVDMARFESTGSDSPFSLGLKLRVLSLIFFLHGLEKP